MSGDRPGSDDQATDVHQPAPTPHCRDDALAKVLDEYVNDLQAGHAPCHDELLAQHPDLADELRSCLDGIDFVQGGDANLVPQQLGDFRIGREIGRGGMGIVYEAEQISLNRRVAIKVLRYPVADQEAMERFRREAETAANLHHTSIVPIHAIGRHEDLHFFAMQLVEGRSLDHVLQDADRIDPHQAAGWALQAAEALTHAHERDVIHRDVKPSNLILDPDGRIWLTDFGLAVRLNDVRLSMTGALLGTPRYMSPEQASSVRVPVDQRSDIYSLGATLFEVVTGQPVFDADTPHAVIGKIISDDPIPPRTIRGDVPRDLDTIIMKCLRKEPFARYQSARDMASDLRAFIEHRPIRARRPTSLDLAKRWWSKNRRQVSTAAVAAIAATVLIAAIVGGRTAYQKSTVGQVTLKTGQRLLTAEIRDEQGENVVPPFTLPNQQPLDVREGNYRLRLTAPRQLGTSVSMAVQRGQDQELTMNLPDRKLFELDVPAAWETIQRDEQADLVLFTKEGVTCLDGHIQIERWSVDLPGATAVSPFSDSDPGFRWNLQVDPSPSGRYLLARYPRVVSPAPDLDDDGVADVVLACRHRASLLALSGSNGQPLWLFSRRAAQEIETGGLVRSTSLGQPLVRDVNADGVVDFVVATAHLDSRQAGKVRANNSVEAVSGVDGKSLWHRELPAAWFDSKEWSRDGAKTAPITARWRFTGGGDGLGTSSGTAGQHVYYQGSSSRGLNNGVFVAYPPRIVTIDGHEVALVVAGSRLCRLDLANGEDAHEVVSLGYCPVRPPQLADLDGDGQTDLLLCRQRTEANDGRSGGALTLSSLRLDTAEELWSYTAEADWQWQFTHAQPQAVWPLIEDLDGDGVNEILIPDGNSIGREVWRTAPTGRLQTLRGDTGKPVWVQSPAINTVERQVERFVIGPDLDGDGTNDVIVVSLHGRIEDQSLSLFFDAISGADGRKLGWQSQSLPSRGSRDDYRVAEMFWWGDSDDAELVVCALSEPGLGAMSVVYCFDPWRMEVARSVPATESPRLVELDGDGRDDLIVFSPNDRELFDRGGKLSAWRATDPQTWQSVGQAAKLVQDANDDGVPDLVTSPATHDSRLRLTSGNDGQLLWQIDSGVREGISLPLDVDLDGDDKADLLVSQAGYRRSPGVPLKAISARTGRTLWQLHLEDLPREWYEPLAVRACDVEGDSSPGLLVLVRTPYQLPSARRVHDRQSPLWLFCISGRNGSVRWHRELVSQAALRTAKIDLGVYGEIPVSSKWSFQLPFCNASYDLNNDEVLDVLTTGIDEQSQLGLLALDGKTGDILWSHLSSPSQRQHRTTAIVANLDSDPSPEVAYLAAFWKNRKVFLQAIVLDSSTGQLDWTWQTEVHRMLGSTVGTGDQQRWGYPFPQAVHSGEGSRRLGFWLFTTEGQVEYLTLKEDESNPGSAIVDGEIVLHEGGSEIAEIGDWLSRLSAWTADVDGDTLDDVVVALPDAIAAYELTSSNAVWKHATPGRQNTILDVVNLGAVSEVRVSSAGDLDSSAVTVLGIDLASGRTNWHCESPRPTPDTPTTEWIEIGNRVDAAPLLLYSLPDELAVSVQATSDRTQSELGAESIRVAKAPWIAHETPRDSRHAQSLPWSPPRQSSSGFLANVGLMMLMTGVLVYTPARYIDRLVKGKQWSLRRLMAAPLVVGLILLVLRVPLPEELRVSNPYLSEVVSRYFAALIGLPWFYACLVAITAIWNRRWRAVLVGCTICLVVSLLFAGLLLLPAWMSLGREDYFMLDGWWMILLVGVQMFGLLALLVRGGVRLIERFLGRPIKLFAR